MPELALIETIEALFSIEGEETPEQAEEIRELEQFFNELFP